MNAADDVWTGPRRFETAEEMDAPAIDVGQLSNALAFIRRINQWLGYTRATVAHLDRLTAELPEDRPLRVLDVATGSADVPVAVREWATRRGRAVTVIGLDLHAKTLTAAADYAGPDLPLVRADALALPFADRAFDVVMTSMFLHHLPDARVTQVLREMHRVAGHAVLAADLVRDRRAYAWIWMLTAGSDPMLRHDARVSVKQAFRLDEIRRLAALAGLHAPKVTKHLGHRFVLTARR